MNHLPTRVEKRRAAGQRRAYQENADRLKNSEAHAILALNFLSQITTVETTTGRYQTASEVVREALRAIEERDQMAALRLQELRNLDPQGFEERCGNSSRHGGG